MRILLVEPWMDGSHKSWAEGFRSASSYQVDVVSLPGELWRWRLRGGALPLGQQVIDWVEAHGAPDVLLVSGLVDVAELLGIARRCLAPTLPVVVYQHESQLVYPVFEGDYDHGAALRNWLSWCTADLVLFNSYHHLRSVSAALPGFVQSLPDGTHRPHLEEVLAKFEVCPVGVDLTEVASAGDRQRRARRSGPPVILWPHRWERDKDPAAFLAALRKMERCGREFRLILAGQDPPSGSTYASAERARAEREFGHRLAASGSFDRAEYLQHLSDADLVVSCARHEFFGLAVVEAVAAGCLPILPHGLSYPELIRPPWHCTALYEPGSFGTRLLEAVDRIDELRAASVGLAESMHRFSWSSMAQVYDDRLKALTGHATTRLRSVG